MVFVRYFFPTSSIGIVGPRVGSAESKQRNVFYDDGDMQPLHDHLIMQSVLNASGRMLFRAQINQANDNIANGYVRNVLTMTAHGNCLQTEVQLLAIKRKSPVELTVLVQHVKK